MGNFASFFWKMKECKRFNGKICEIKGAGMMHRNTTAVWFKRFNNGDTSLPDQPRSKRLPDVDHKALQALAEQPHFSTRELLEILGLFKTTPKSTHKTA